MNVLAQIAQVCHILPPEQQVEVGVRSRLIRPPEKSARPSVDTKDLEAKTRFERLCAHGVGLKGGKKP
jgi:hypothetical protein